MRNLLIFFFIIITIVGFGQDNVQSEKSKGTIPRSVLVVPFYNMTPRKYEFNFLSEALRDALTSKLQNSDQFYFVSSMEIQNKMNSLNLTPQSMNEVSNALKLATALKADIVVMGKFYILENKVMISTRAYDLIDFQDIVSSVDGNTGVDIFVIVDALGSDMARKMIEKYPKMEEMKSANHLFANNYSGIKLGEDYKTVKNLVANSKFLYNEYRNRKLIILNGYQNDAFKTNFTAYYFDKNDKLSNIFLLASNEPLTSRKIVIADNKQKMIRLFGEKFNIMEGENYRWDGKDFSFELLNKLIYKGNLTIFYHYYTNENKVEFSQLEKDVNILDKGVFEITVGALLDHSVYMTFQEFLIKTKVSIYDYINEKYVDNYNSVRHYLGQMKIGFGLPISFSYIYARNSIGATLAFKYLTAIRPRDFSEMINEKGFVYYINTFQIELLLRNKFLDKVNLNQKYVVEFGAMFESEFTSTDYINEVENYNYVRVRRSRVPNNTLPVLYTGAGPILKIGKEFRYANFTYEPLFVLGATFGGDTYFVDGKTISKNYQNNPYFQTNIFLGHEIRFGYYKTIMK